MNRYNWLGVLAVGIGAVLGSNATALATPNMILAQVGVRGVQSTVNGPKSLNITAPPGSHIPLPESNYRYSDRYYRDDYHHDHHHHHDYHHHRRDRGTTIIINPPVYNTPRHRDRYIKIIRRR